MHLVYKLVLDHLLHVDVSGLQTCFRSSTSCRCIWFTNLFMSVYMTLLDEQLAPRSTLKCFYYQDEVSLMNEKNGKLNEWKEWICYILWEIIFCHLSRTFKWQWLYGLCYIHGILFLNPQVPLSYQEILLLKKNPISMIMTYSFTLCFLC